MLVFGYFYVWLCIPETKGLSLEEVDEMYRAGIRPWHSATWRPSDKPVYEHEAKEVRDQKDEQCRCYSLQQCNVLATRLLQHRRLQELSAIGREHS